MTQRQQQKQYQNTNSNKNRYQQQRNDLQKYIQKMNIYINKARGIHNKIINKKKNNIIHLLDRIKLEVDQQTQKYKNLENFFYLHCQKILENDVEELDCYQKYFNKIFQLYQIKINSQMLQINNLKKLINNKKNILKQTLYNFRPKYTQQKLIDKILTQRKYSKLTKQSKNKKFLDNYQPISRVQRIKTQITYPSISSVLGTKIIGDQGKGKSHYGKSRKILKYCQKSNKGWERIIDMLVWYKDYKQKQYNWFEKLIFGDWNFRKIVNKISGE